MGQKENQALLAQSSYFRGKRKARASDADVQIKALVAQGRIKEASPSPIRLKVTPGAPQERRSPSPPSLGKYGAEKTQINGLWFDSKKEAGRYQQLALLQRAGEISELTLQPEWDILVSGVKICAYRADFSYLNILGELIVEDVKSTPTKTRAYRLKKKLMQAVHGIVIVEI